MKRARAIRLGKMQKGLQRKPQMPTVPPGGLAVRPDLCRPRQNAKEAQAGEDLSGPGEDLQLSDEEEIAEP